MFAESRDERAIIPKRAFLAGLETRPNLGAIDPQIVHDGAGVVQFIGSGDEAGGS